MIMTQDLVVDTAEEREREEAELKQLARYFYALKEVWRLRMLHALAEAEELTVSDLAERMGISQPLVSWHLRRLRQAKIVRVRREGRESYYSLDKEQVAIYRSIFEGLLHL
jgi:DNA-binding transcriptional ArsR family regulator